MSPPLSSSEATASPANSANSAPSSASHNARMARTPSHSPDRPHPASAGTIDDRSSGSPPYQDSGTSNSRRSHIATPEPKQPAVILPRHQLVVRPSLSDPAMIEHVDAVGVADAGQPVRDEHDVRPPASSDTRRNVSASACGSSRPSVRREPGPARRGRTRAPAPPSATAAGHLDPAELVQRQQRVPAVREFVTSSSAPRRPRPSARVRRRLEAVAAIATLAAKRERPARVVLRQDRDLLEQCPAVQVGGRPAVPRHGPLSGR